MKKNLSRTVRMVSPLSPDEVRRRIRLEFMPGDPCYSGKVEEMSFLLESSTDWLLGRRVTLENVTRISVCPNLHVSLNPCSSGTIIGVYTVPALFSRIGLFRYFPMLWLINDIIWLLLEWDIVTLLMLCGTPLLLLYWWLIWRKMKCHYTAGTDKILKRLATILQATLEDLSEK